MNAETFQWPFLFAGLIVGMFGWLLYWAGIPIIGGIVGAFAGGTLGILISDFVQAPNAMPFLLGAGVVLGAVLGLLLMRAIQAYFFFAVGACLGGALAWRLLGVPAMAEQLAGSAQWSTALIVLAGAAAGGFMMVFFRRFIVAMVTSVGGTVLLMYGLPPRYQLLGGLVGLVVFFSIQIGLVRRFVEQDEFDRRMKRYREKGLHADEE